MPMPETRSRRMFITALLAAPVAPILAAAAHARTAKADALAALAIARQWQADAALTGIQTFDAGIDGTAKSWSFQFYSRSARRGLSLQWQGGKPFSQEMPPGATTPVGQFIDSDLAMSAARKHGLRSKGPVPMTLRALGGGSSEAIYWSIGTAFGDGEVAVVLAAKDGALITTHTGS